MTFNVTVHENGIPEYTGRLREVYGLWGSTGTTTTGDISTGLREVIDCQLQRTGSATDALTEATINETFPLAGGDVTIICDATSQGTFKAVGR